MLFEVSRKVQDIQIQWTEMTLGLKVPIGSPMGLARARKKKNNNKYM